MCVCVCVCAVKTKPKRDHTWKIYSPQWKRKGLGFSWMKLNSDNFNFFVGLKCCWSGRVCTTKNLTKLRASLRVQTEEEKRNTRTINSYNSNSGSNRSSSSSSSSSSSNNSNRSSNRSSSSSSSSNNSNRSSNNNNNNNNSFSLSFRWIKA